MKEIKSFLKTKLTPTWHGLYGALGELSRRMMWVAIKMVGVGVKMVGDGWYQDDG